MDTGRLKTFRRFPGKRVILNPETEGGFYVEDSQIKSYLGVDVSVHQDDIDWNEVKRAGIDFAMIRLGFRGYGTGEAQLDDNYRQNIDGARAPDLTREFIFFLRP